MPQGVVVDAQGRVYVADSLEGHIQALDRSGTFVGFIADFGEAAGQLRIPMDLVIDPSNRLFITAANNARLEMFGLDAFADPETITPAVVRIDPDPIERTASGAALVAYLETPAYSLDHIVPHSLRANGVSAASHPIVIGDHDGNGTPDVRVEFDRAAVLATLPADGAGSITINGAIADTQLEATAIVHTTTCGPDATCPLGAADPQCNAAACVPPLGCTIQPKPDGTGCEDGDACTVGDVCSGGVCVGAPLSCNDGNECTDDRCDPAGGCVQAGNTAPCDDGDPGTVSDGCDGSGACTGHVVTGNYALLGWPLQPPGHRSLALSAHVLVRGSICGERVVVGSESLIEGDTIASASRGWGILLALGSRFAADLVTGGAAIIGSERVAVDGRVDRSGAATEILECAAARHRANSRWEELAGLSPSPGLTLGDIDLAPGSNGRIPSAGSLGTGPSVVEVGEVRLRRSSTLTLVGTGGASTVVVRVRGRMMLGPGARIQADGLQPEQVIFAVDGSAGMQSNVSVAGSVFAAGRVRLGRSGVITGALLGSDLDLAPYATVDLHPFAGW
jgi:hypothetical protein